MNPEGGDEGVEGVPEHWEGTPLSHGDIGYPGAGSAGQDPAAHPLEGDHFEPQRLALDGEDRLPWLEGGEDDEEYEAVDAKRVIGVVLAGLLVLAGVVGAVWWGTHRHDAGQPIADGSTVAAPAGPYKAPPASPGGKTYEGTGDTSFAVSQGQNPSEHLAESGNGGAAGAASPAAASAAGPADGAATNGAATHGAAPHDAATNVAGGDDGSAGWSGGIAQIGAFYSQARAQTAWSQLSQAHDALADARYRIAAGQVDNATVYRLQVLTAPDAAGALCDKLRASGLACQVKH